MGGRRQPSSVCGRFVGRSTCLLCSFVPYKTRDRLLLTRSAPKIISRAKISNRRHALDVRLRLMGAGCCLVLAVPLAASLGPPAPRRHKPGQPAFDSSVLQGDMSLG